MKCAVLDVSYILVIIFLAEYLDLGMDLDAVRDVIDRASVVEVQHPLPIGVRLRKDALIQFQKVWNVVGIVFRRDDTKFHNKDLSR